MSPTRKIFLFIALPLVLVFAFLAISYLFGGANRGRQAKTETKQASNESKSPASCDKNPAPVFTSNFVSLDKLQSIAPIGGVMVGSPARSYIVVKGVESGSDRDLATLYAPTDAVLEGIVFARRDPSNPNAKGEYRLDFRASCEVTFHYDHLDDVSPEIKAISPTEPDTSTRNAKKVELKVKAGELVGYSDGTDQAGGFDFYLLNSAKTVPHINPKRWVWEQTTIADCPYDYFSAELKAKYYDLFRSQDNTKLLKNECGSPSHDIEGTASGGWFLTDADTDSNGNWLEVANINGRSEILHREAGNHKFKVRDYTSAVKPDALKVGMSQCYSEQGKWAYIRVDSETKLTLARGDGSCPSSLPTTSSETWTR